MLAVPEIATMVDEGHEPPTAEARFFTRKVFRGGQLHVRNIALKRRHRQSRPFCNRGIIGEIIAAFTRGTSGCAGCRSYTYTFTGTRIP